MLEKVKLLAKNTIYLWVKRYKHQTKKILKEFQKKIHLINYLIMQKRTRKTNSRKKLNKKKF